MTTPAETTGTPAPGRPRRRSRLGSLYELFLRSQTTRARLLSLAGLGLVAVLVAFAVGRSGPAEADQVGVDFVNGIGLSVLAPVTALVFASAAFGDIREDGTMVYLWLRPVPRPVVVGAAYLATLTVAVPMVVVPLALSAGLISGDSGVVVGAIASTTLAVVTYAALFLALGLRVRRALVWGLAYILIWEGFVAQAGGIPSRLAIRAYTRSILADLSGAELELATVSQPWAVLVPLAVAAAALAYATHRFQRQDVD